MKVGSSGELVESSRVAIVALFWNEALAYRRSLTNLLTGLTKNGVQPYLVVNGQCPEELKSLAAGFNCIIVERRNRGRDFGAYQAGILWLEETGQLALTKTLMLINDTMHWFRESSEIVTECVSHDWSATHFNFEDKPHAQSFFLSFSEQVINNPEFLKFWRNYAPLNSRIHAINFGEIKLSTTLIGEGFVCCPYVTPTRIEIGIKRRVLDYELIQVALSVPISNEGRVELSKFKTGRKLISDSVEFKVSHQLRNVGLDRPILDSVDANKMTKEDANHTQMSMMNSLEKQTLRTLAAYAHSQPSHRIGIHLYALLDLPLKIDIYKVYPLSDIVRVVRLLDPQFADDFYHLMLTKAMRYARGDRKTARLRALGEI